MKNAIRTISIIAIIVAVLLTCSCRSTEVQQPFGSPYYDGSSDFMFSEQTVGSDFMFSEPTVGEITDKPCVTIDPSVGKIEIEYNYTVDHEGHDLTVESFSADFSDPSAYKFFVTERSSYWYGRFPGRKAYVAYSDGSYDTFADMKMTENAWEFYRSSSMADEEDIAVAVEHFIIRVGYVEGCCDDFDLTYEYLGKEYFSSTGDAYRYKVTHNGIEEYEICVDADTGVNVESIYYSQTIKAENIVIGSEADTYDFDPYSASDLF